MKKRIIALFMCFSVLFTCNACEDKKEEKETRGIEYFTMPVAIENDAPKENKTEKKAESEEDKIEGTGKGKIVGDSYVNEAFGFEFTMPDGVGFLPLDEMSNMLFLNGDYQMIASDIYGNNVTILHMYMYRDDDITDVGRELYASMEQQYDASEVNYEMKNKGLVQFVNNEANLITINMYTGDVDVYQELFIIGRDDRYLMFIFTGMDENREAIDTLKKAFEPFGKVVDKTDLYKEEI